MFSFRRERAFLNVTRVLYCFPGTCDLPLHHAHLVVGLGVSVEARTLRLGDAVPGGVLHVSRGALASRDAGRRAREANQRLRLARLHACAVHWDHVASATWRQNRLHDNADVMPRLKWSKLGSLPLGGAGGERLVLAGVVGMSVGGGGSGRHVGQHSPATGGTSSSVFGCGRRGRETRLSAWSTWVATTPQLIIESVSQKEGLPKPEAQNSRRTWSSRWETCAARC